VIEEELLFRGVVLPRMKCVFGRRDWIANGALFAVYYLHQPWSIPNSLVEGAFLEAYPSRGTKARKWGVLVHSVPSAFAIIVVSRSCCEPWSPTPNRSTARICRTERTMLRRAGLAGLGDPHGALCA
jgi:Type II CAAX prenyl endopeptidase Rce1-like